MRKFTQNGILIATLFFAHGVFALVQDWDFDNQANYSFSDTSLLEVDGGVAELSNINIFDANWRMDEAQWDGTTGEVKDASPYEKDGTAHGASLDQGKIGNGGHFVKTEKDYLDFGIINNPGINDFSYGGWFKTTESSDTGYIIARSVYSAADGRYAIGTRSNGHVRTFLDLGNEPYVESSTPYNDGHWHLAIAQVDRDGYLELYVDNVFIGRTDISSQSNFDYTGYDRNFYTGVYNDSTGLSPHTTFGYFNGDIDETFFINRLLSQEEMDTLWNSGNGGRVLQYSDAQPYIQPLSAISFSRRVNHFYETTAPQHEGEISYQVSSDNGTTWKYWDGNAWINTTQTDGTETNIASEVDTHIIDFDNDGGDFLWRAFFVSDGQEKVVLDKIQLIYDVNTPPTITSDGGGDTAFLSLNENQTSVTTVSATDPEGDTITYAIPGGADQTLFQIDNTTGALSFTTAPDYENPIDANQDNVYEVEVSASDGFLQDTQALFITITNLNEAPHFTSPTTITIPENQTNITMVSAEDPDQGDTLTYSIEAGLDDAHFQIDSTTGALSFTTAPDYENPTDSNGDNTYEVSLSVTDNQGLTDNQTLSVHISDVNEQTHRHRSHRAKRKTKTELQAIFGTPTNTHKETATPRGTEQEEIQTQTCQLSLTHLLKKGMRGNAVRQLQHCLNTLGYSVGPEDGIFGPQTYRGVIAFQQAKQLRFIDGIVGKETLNALMEK